MTGPWRHSHGMRVLLEAESEDHWLWKMAPRPTFECVGGTPDAEYLIVKPLAGSAAFSPRVLMERGLSGPLHFVVSRVPAFVTHLRVDVHFFPVEVIVSFSDGKPVGSYRHWSHRRNGPARSEPSTTFSVLINRGDDVVYCFIHGHCTYYVCFDIDDISWSAPSLSSTGSMSSSSVDD